MITMHFIKSKSIDRLITVGLNGVKVLKNYQFNYYILQF